MRRSPCQLAFGLAVKSVSPCARFAFSHSSSRPRVSLITFGRLAHIKRKITATSCRSRFRKHLSLRRGASNEEFPMAHEGLSTPGIALSANSATAPGRKIDPRPRRQQTARSAHHSPACPAASDVTEVVIHQRDCPCAGDCHLPTQQAGSGSPIPSWPRRTASEPASVVPLGSITMPGPRTSGEPGPVPAPLRH
jgi:hypothetical protein